MLTTTSAKFILSPPYLKKNGLIFSSVRRKKNSKTFIASLFFEHAHVRVVGKKLKPAFVKNVSFHHDAKEEEKIVGFFVIVRKKKVKSTSFLKLCKTQKRYYIYIMILARNVSHFIFPGLHYVCTNY